MLVDGMTPVIMTSATNYSTISENDRINKTDTYKDWYNYGNDSKRWANAKLPDGSIYVWIPRYAYSIDSTEEKVNIEFMKGSSSLITTSGKALSNNYKVIPAFEDGSTTGFSNGEWSSEITGIWVAKYEAILTDNYGKSYSATSNATVSQSVSNMATYCTNIKTSVSNMDVSNVDTHLMKNSEWGAVAYLTWSDYGNLSITAKQGFNTQLTSQTNTLSTGNYYGVDGLVGGTQDIVATGVDVTALNSSNTSTKYVTLYGSSSTQNGDGINLSEISWTNNDRGTVYPNADNPFFARGGYNNYGSSISSTELFTYLSVPNASNNVTGFRPVLIIEY